MLVYYWKQKIYKENLFCFLSAYNSFFIVGLILSMQIPFVGFNPISTSEHMASAGKNDL